jgi:CRISPR/Cas system CSM-associated protein Csm3 (group 7 of RAMP superfamily)
MYGKENLSGTLYGHIIARSPVHVASGLLEKSNDRKYPLVKGHFRTGNTLAIPGTSLKGCIRSMVEAITPSAVQISRRRMDVPSEYQPRRVQSGGKLNHNTIDVAQRIFGAMGYQGMVCFRDAKLKEGEPVTVPSPPLYRPRPESQQTYFQQRKLKGRKFYMHGELANGNLPLEACPPGSEFVFRMEFENLSKVELGILLLALGLGEPKLHPKLGGGKPVCLGTIEIIPDKLELWDAKSAYADFDMEQTLFSGEVLQQKVNEMVQAAGASDLLLDEQVKQLADILRWPREDRDCPSEVY